MRNFLAALLVVHLCGGCLAKQVATDGIGVRQAILDMYTDQVMDNLVRAKNNLPFVQLSYSTIQVNDLHDLSSTGSLAQTVTTLRNLIVAGVTKTVTNTATGSLGADCKRTMNFTANPITDQDDVYDRYLQFARDGSLFVVTDRPPPPCAAHILRECAHRYYWVPAGAGEQFLALCMDTTFKRAPVVKVAIPGFYTVKIDAITVEPREGGRRYVNAVLTFDNKKLPNEAALLIVDLPDRKVSLKIFPVEGADAKTPTGTFRTQIPDSLKVTGADLTERSGRFYSYEIPAETPVAAAPLGEINANLSTIRAQLQNQKK